MDREGLLRSLIDTGGIGLEVGPGFNPLLPKSEGYRVETVDYADAESLRKKYAGANVDTGRIESVDHLLTQGGSLADLLGKTRHFDYIVALHVIEHMPDLLGFLKSCETLLKNDGVLLLAVPDKRRCFDLFQPLTTTGAVLQAHLERRTRPAPGAVFDDRAYNVVRNGSIGWSADDDGPLSFFSDLGAAYRSFREAAGSDRYIDVHVWRFVPSSFRLILRDLREIREIGLCEKAFLETEGNEFYAALSRGGSASENWPEDRLVLAQRAQVEHSRIRVEGSPGGEGRTE